MAFYEASFGTSFASSTLVGSTSTARGTLYSIPWNTASAANGSTTLWALSTDTSNNTSTALTTVRVTNGSAPSITSFFASPSIVASAGTSTLSWNAAGTITSIAISPGSFSTSTASGKWTVNPTSTTLYTLTATNANGTTTATTSVSVIQVPVISAISSGTPLATAATISWTTNPAADSLVKYGTSSSYTASSTYNASYVTSHSVTLTGLNSLTLYHYEILSSDGILATSSDQTFTTASAGLPSASNVGISGTTTIGQTLTGTYTFSDPNNKPESGSTYAWLRSPSSGGTYTSIASATADTYTLASADIGQYLRFQVTPASLSGTGSSAESSPTSQIESGGVPVVSGVSISRTSTEGDPLTGNYTYSQANGVPQGTSLYQWFEASSAKGTYGATGNTYALSPSDVGQYLEFQVTPVAEYPPTTGTAVMSTPVGAIAPSSLPIASNVTVSGTTTIGSTLTGSYTYTDSGNHPQGSSTFAWFMATSSNGTYSPISGATSLTYALGTSSVADYLKFQVTPVSSVATGTPVLPII